MMFSPHGQYPYIETIDSYKYYFPKSTVHIINMYDLQSKGKISPKHHGDIAIDFFCVSCFQCWCLLLLSVAIRRDGADPKHEEKTTFLILAKDEGAPLHD